MIRILQLTLMADLTACVCLFIYFSIGESLSYGLYVAAFSFGNILIPTFLAVLIYKIINRFFKSKNPSSYFLLIFFLLLIAYFGGLYCWAIIETSSFDNFSWDAINDDFKEEFLGYLPIAFIYTILIPALDNWLTKRKYQRNFRRFY